MTYHNLGDSLLTSHRRQADPWWETIYRSFFPDFDHMESTIHDAQAQKEGIDRRVVLSGGSSVAIEEKARERKYSNDILLEFWSVWRPPEYRSEHKPNIPGWVARDLGCEFVAYAFVPDALCFLIPFVPLRAAWREHHDDWFNRYEVPGCKNESPMGPYLTRNVAVPTDVLMVAVPGIRQTRWS